MKLGKLIHIVLLLVVFATSSALAGSVKNRKLCQRNKFCGSGQELEPFSGRIPSKLKSFRSVANRPNKRGRYSWQKHHVSYATHQNQTIRDRRPVNNPAVYSFSGAR